MATRRELIRMTLVEQGERAHRGQNVVAQAVIGREIVRIARRHQGHAMASRERCEDARQVQIFIVMRRHLEREIRAIGVAQELQRGRRVFVAFDGRGDFAARAGQADQPLGELLQIVVRESIGMLNAGGQQAAKAAVPASVFDEQHKRRAAVERDLAADHRMDARLASLLIKGDRARKRVAIDQPDSFHAAGYGRLDDLFRRHAAIEHRVIAVIVKCGVAHSRNPISQAAAVGILLPVATGVPPFSPRSLEPDVTAF